MDRMRVSRVRWYVCCEEDRPVAQYRVPGVFWWRPNVRKAVLLDGRWVDASEPAFPGYLFVGATRGWRHIVGVLPDLELIRMAGEPYELTEKEVVIARLFDEVQFNVTGEALFPGARVKVNHERHSAYAGLEGTVLKRVPVVGGEQACVEFFLCDKVVSGLVPLDHLEVVRA